MQQSLFPTAASVEAVAANPKGICRHDLNAAQYEAVTAMDGALLVIAGAGSGKTRTLIYRVAHLIENGVAPESILLLTFTRKAAREMLWRASQLMGGACQTVTGGTFHGVANLLLRRYGHYLGYNAGFTILDRSDAEGIINILKSSLGMGGATRRFPSKRVVLDILSKSVNKAVSIEDLLFEEYPHLEEFFHDIETLQGHYERFKQEHGLMDYDDLLVNWKRVMAENEVVREELSQRFRYIMVDEYQDTNPIQAGIVRLLAAGHNNVMVVGDDAQSIYSFRGANFRNIMDFPRLFTNTRIIKLEENYRSAQPILDLTNALIARAGEKYAKTLFSRIVGDHKPMVVEARDATAEAWFVADRLQESHQEGLPYQDMAVLFRSGFHSYKLEIELSSRQIPFEKRGGLKLTESAHTKDVLAFFRILVNGRDHLSWNRILLMLPKVGPKTAAKILTHIKAADDPVAALGGYAAAPAWGKGLVALASTLESLRQPTLLPTDQYEIIIEYYRPIFERLYFDDYPRRSKDIEHLKTIVGTYDSLPELVNDTALDPPETMTGADADEGDRLVLSTIHSAKGLEWNTVFIINLVEGRFPVSNNMPPEQYEEERRLLYVAATRAKKHLVMTYPAVLVAPDRQIIRGRLSPYVAELEAGLYQMRQHGGLDNMTGRHRSYRPSSGRNMAALPTAKLSGQVVGSFQVGDVVKHGFFGRGIIKGVVGDRTVEVMFDRHGRKVLHLDYARLETLGGSA